MVTGVQTLEFILPDVTEAIGRANWHLQDIAIRWQAQSFPDATVDAIDVAYCEIETACDRIRQALVARQREQRLREAPELALEGMD